MRKQYLILLSLWLGLASGAVAQNYPSMEQFGKNRIQYRGFSWRTIRTANFEIYFYQDGNQLANLTAQYAESEFDRITELLGYTPYNRIKIFLFNSPQELAQSNIGINAFGELSNREADLAKSRVELAFTGDQISFRRQLIRDVSMLFVYDMLYGGSLKDALQSSLLLTLPDWFMPGIASYIAEGWSVELDDYMRDVSLNQPVRKPSLLTGREAERVGHSIWNYIAQRYGKDNISNILNLTRIIRDERSSIQSTLGVPYARFLREWREFYASGAQAVVQSYQGGSDDFRIKLSSRDKLLQLKDLKLSADKQLIAYSTVRDGRFSVEVVNTANRKKTGVLQGGYRLDGQPIRSNAPLVAWGRDNDLVVVTEERGKTYVYTYTNVDRRPRLRAKNVLNGLSQVESIDASADGGSLIMSAERRGQNDLFLYSLNRGTYQQLTNDLYDDLNPHFVGRTTRNIVFASNRRLDTLNADKGTFRTIRDRTSLFRHEGGPRATNVVRLSDTLTNARQPIAASESVVYYVGDANGVRNLYRIDNLEYDSTGRLTSASAPRQLTALPFGIQQYDLNPTNGGFVYSSLANGDLYIGYRAQLNVAQTVQAPPTQRTTVLGLQSRPASATAPASATVAATADSTRAAANPLPTDSTGARSGQAGNVVAINPDPEKRLEPGEVDTDNYRFDPDVLASNEFRQRRTNTTIAVPSGTSLTTPRPRRRENITIRGPFDYRGLFIANDVSSNWRVDPIRGFGFTQTITMNDLLENHVIKAGLFITTTLRNSDLFAEYQNLTHRIDFGARVDRQTLFVDPLLRKYRYNRVALSASYPISVTSRFTISPFYALTRMLDLQLTNSTDQVSDYGGVRGEFVFDNTKINGMNMLEGTRFKARFDQFTGLRSASESFYRFTIDARHYQKIHRDLMLAVRLSYGQSGGPSPKLSTLGGMENWIATREAARDPNRENPLRVEQDAGRDNRDVFFLDFAAPLRGFRQGKLTGNSHLLLNTELRLPLVKYLYRGNITSNFLRNLQLVAFSDIGVAWTGVGPLQRENSLNTDVVGGGNLPFRAVVTNFKNPFLMGYGAGVRTMLFGYYVKFDYAWGIENNVVSRPIAYVTLGYDF